MRGDVLVLLADGLVILCLARFWLQRAGLDSRHPLAAFVMQTTDWLVNPLGKILPPKRAEWACVIAGLLLYYLVFSVMTLVASPFGFGMKVVLANMLFSLLGVLKSLAYVLLIGLVIRMVCSFRSPYSPLAVALQRVFAPLLAPFSFLRIGRYDFSGSLLVLVLWLWLGRLLPQLVMQLNLWLLH
ncbi:YggT family protein [Neisseria animalis]|uniref:YggT family protein n=1 Tax=Neisseria animalis TaxID=492 RepID=A0A5P3MQN3_NEIAN|nr:YggT family protein [Neisseria animalis]QEY23903.1 YggT family protein [Neisseria animalis]ROW32029.1 YggT family protein [Neisseria animalis]VEE05829.1 YGGT family [Neisseria animalis]